MDQIAEGRGQRRNEHSRHRERSNWMIEWQVAARRRDILVRPHGLATFDVEATANEYSGRRLREFEDGTGPLLRHWYFYTAYRGF